MTDRPIIFSAPMVRALLDGRKTQTRRLLNPQPATFLDGDRECEVAAIHLDGESVPRVAVGRCITLQKLRYAVSDRLYVRENFYQFGGPIAYAADGLPEFPRKMTPCIHMPRWASRLTLVVEDVKVERLQEISEEDAFAEGISFGPAERHGDHPSKWILGRCRDCAHWNTNLHPNGGKRLSCPYHYGDSDPSPAYGDAGQGCSTSFAIGHGADETAHFQFLKFWDHLHGLGLGSAKHNPFVVALTFRVEHGNIDRLAA